MSRVVGPPGRAATRATPRACGRRLVFCDGGWYDLGSAGVTLTSRRRSLHLPTYRRASLCIFLFFCVVLYCLVLLFLFGHTHLHTPDAT